MTAPQLDISDIAAELESEPLSKALFERAQLKVLARRQAEQIDEQAAHIQALTARVDELERQKPQAPGGS